MSNSQMAVRYKRREGRRKERGQKILRRSITLSCKRLNLTLKFYFNFLAYSFSHYAVQNLVQVLCLYLVAQSCPSL